MALNLPFFFQFLHHALQQLETQLMNNAQICLCLPDYRDRAQHFMREQGSNMFLILKNKLFPVHKQFLTDSNYLKNQLKNLQSTICVINEDLDANFFEKILGFLYGLNLQCFRDWEIVKILEIVQFLDVTILKQMLFQDIEKNQDDYCVFVLFTIAHKFEVAWVRQVCIRLFIEMQFQQINYNRYELIQCEKLVLQQIFKLIIKYQKQKKIVILEFQELKQIVNQYNKQHEDTIDANQFLIPVQDVINQINSQYQKSSINTDGNNSPMSFLNLNFKTAAYKLERSQKFSNSWIQEIQDQSSESVSVNNDNPQKRSSNKKETLSNKQQKTSSLCSFNVRRLASSFESYLNSSNICQHEKLPNESLQNPHFSLLDCAKEKNSFQNSFQSFSAPKKPKVKKMYSTMQLAPLQLKDEQFRVLTFSLTPI